MKKSVFIGIDVGGTNLRCALVDCSGKILESTRASEGGDPGARSISDKLVSQCLSLKEKAAGLGSEVSAIGLGIAGKIDKNSGLVVFSPNLPALNDYPLGRELAKKTGIPVFMENDANVFCLGESWAGAAKGLPNWLGITLGTGTGGCLFLNGKLWEGDGLGFSAEIGHTIIEPGGPICSCGLKGHLESFASARALIRGAKEIILEKGLKDGPLCELLRTDKLGADTIYECAMQGDAAAGKLFDKMGWALGIGLANVFTLLGIRHAVIGGGVSASWELFIGPLEESLSKNLSMLEQSLAVVLRNSLGDDAALIGAARMAQIASG